MRIDKAISDIYKLSRSKAQTLIKEGNVSVNGVLVQKDSFDVKDSDTINLVNTMEFVGRGGYKLKKAISYFKLDFHNKVVVDIGASTGGFTDCSLQNGAKKVYSIDVGHDQLDEQIRSNSKVVVMEGTNFKDVQGFSEAIDFFVMDVSFVSIKEMIQKIKENASINSYLVTLIKPQFEVGIGKTKKGIVKDPKLHIEVLKEIYDSFLKQEIYMRNLTFSPIKGKNGNIEYLALLAFSGKAQSFDFKKIVNDAFLEFK